MTTHSFYFLQSFRPNNLFNVSLPVPVETRKALLQTLSPLLTQAENARKTDHEIIEGHTRCTIERVNNKSCAYKYTDIDNGNHVAPSEYEKRYESSEHSLAISSMIFMFLDSSLKICFEFIYRLVSYLDFFRT